MKIGIDASNLRAGGGITHLREFLNAARPERHGIDRVLVWGGIRTLDCLPRQRWLRAVHEKMLDGSLPMRLFWQRYRLPELARGGCDLLFSPGGNRPVRGCPSVVMCRNMLPFEPAELGRYSGSFQYVRLKLLRMAQSRSFQNADGVIFLSRYARSTVMGQIGDIRGSSIVVPHGVDPRFRKPPRDQASIGAYSRTKPFRLLYVSTIDLYKHQENVAKGVIRLHRNGTPVILDLVGGAYEPARRSLRSLLQALDPSGEVVREHGPTSFSSLESFYHGADAFVFASSCENLPNILIEAMASGLPIACSGRGPMPEVLGDGGVYFDPEDQDATVDTLGRLLSDPDLRSRCARAAYHRAQRYSWDECARSTFCFFEKVLAGPGSVHATEAPANSRQTQSRFS